MTESKDISFKNLKQKLDRHLVWYRQWLTSLKNWEVDVVSNVRFNDVAYYFLCIMNIYISHIFTVFNTGLVSLTMNYMMHDMIIYK